MSAPPAKRRRIENGNHDSSKISAESRANTAQAKNGTKTASSLKGKATHLLESRKQLPIWQHQDEIRQKVRENDVLLLVGETGSGKSTQIPQFLYQEDWCRKRDVQISTSDHTGHGSEKPPFSKRFSVGGTIAILQPRRVAATSLASRVSQEIGTPLGSSSPSSLVGYSVRFDNNVSPSTRIKFLTDGMLLQELGRDPWLREYSCVVVDEVHERGVNIDLVLGFLKRLLQGASGGDGRGGAALKVVVMSATADMEGLEKFFRGSKEGRESNGERVELQNAIQSQNEEFSGFSDDQSSSRGSKRDSEHEPSTLLSNSKAISLASCYIRGRQYPVTIHYSPIPVTNLLDACLDRIIHIHQHTPLPGDVLVFLSGQEMIENLESLCLTYASTLNQQIHQTHEAGRPKKPDLAQRLPKLEVLPLYAALPTAAQQRMFSTPKDSFTRRVILATNIAETSITVPRIRHVIDTGKQKSRYFRAGLNLDTLLSGPVSRSAAKQRAGRAGREAPGHCYRLYTENDFNSLEPDTKPEILQTDLSSLVLTLKSHGVDDVLRFPLLTAPPRKSLEAALLHLLSLDALDEDTGSITQIGRKMAMLPLKPELARILLASTTKEMDCVDEIVDIVAGLALEEGIFLPTRGRHGQHQPNDASTDPTTPDHTMSRIPNRKKSTRDLLVTKTNSTSASNSKTNSDPDTNSNSDSDSDADTPSNPIEQNRRKLLHRHSDHLTLLAAIRAYSSPATADRRAWADAHGISHRAMQRIMDARKQLAGLMKSKRLQLDSSPLPAATASPRPAPSDNTAPAPADKPERILKCLLAGLHPKIALLSSLHPSRSEHETKSNKPPSTAAHRRTHAPYTTLLTSQPIYIHPSSVLFAHGGGRHSSSITSGGGGGGGDNRQRNDGGRPSRNSVASSNMPRAIVFTELVYTSKPYARGVSAVEVGWVLS